MLNTSGNASRAINGVPTPTLTLQLCNELANGEDDVLSRATPAYAGDILCCHSLLLWSGPWLVGRIGSAVRVSANFHKIYCFEGQLGSGPQLEGRVGSSVQVTTALKVTENGTIWKLEYGFLFAFYSNYCHIFSHFWDIQHQRMAWP